MARLVPVALFLSFVAAPAAAQVAVNPETWRVRDISFAVDPAMQLPGTVVGSNGRLGLGTYGLNTDPTRQRAVTVRDVDAPRRRRAGIGFSMKF
jgi:hypothetical protein